MQLPVKPLRRAVPRSWTRKELDGPVIDRQWFGGCLGRPACQLDIRKREQRQVTIEVTSSRARILIDTSESSRLCMISSWYSATI